MTRSLGLQHKNLLIRKGDHDYCKAATVAVYKDVATVTMAESVCKRRWSQLPKLNKN